MMNNNIPNYRIGAIKEQSVPMPLYYTTENPNEIIQCIYIVAMEGQDSLLMPESIVISKETGNGSITTGIYQLTNSSKSNLKFLTTDIDPNEN